MKHPITFTQYLFPDRRKAIVDIDVDLDTFQKANELKAAGWTNDIECAPHTQVVWATMYSPGEEQVVDGYCPNGPEVPGMIVELIKKAHARMRRH